MPDNYPQDPGQQIPPIDPAVLQQALGAQASGPLPGSGFRPPPPPPASMPPPDVQQPPPPQVNLGSTDAPPGAGTASPPRPGFKPAILDVFQKMLGDQSVRGYEPATGGGPGDIGAQPGRPVSRLDAFENFLGQFLYSFSQGMAQGGTGPGANARGFGIAAQAPYQQQLQQYELGQQQQQQQAQIGLQQAEAQRTRAQAQMMPVQIGGQTIYMPPEYAKNVLSSQIGAQARVEAAGVQKRFLNVPPYGLYDTQTKQYVGGPGSGGLGATVKMTQEMADSGQYGPGAQQLVGRDVKLSDLSGMERGTSQSTQIIQTGQGPARVTKAGQTGLLGYTSPTDNLMARIKAGVAIAKDVRPVETNQNQVNLALDRLEELRRNSSILRNMWDAGKISVAMGQDGTLSAIIGRNVDLTNTEQKFAADFQSMIEDINLERIPLGGAGFRGPEGWAGLQSQKGSLLQNPDVFNGVLDNTIDSFRGLQRANQNSLDAYAGYQAQLAGRNKATGGAAMGGGGSKVQNLIKKYGGG